MKTLFQLGLLCIQIVITQSFNLFSQTYTRDFLSIDTTVVFSDIKEFAPDGQRIQLSISSFGNCFDILPIKNSLLKKSDLKINRYNSKTGEFLEYTVKIPQQICSSKERYYLNGVFSFNDSILLYANSYNYEKNKRTIKLLLYSVHENETKNIFSFTDEIDDINDIIYLPNNKLLICSGYLGQKDAKAKFIKLSILNKETGNLEKSINLGIDLAGLSYIQKNKQITVTDSSILFTELGVYKIYEFDFNLNLINTIEKKSKWSKFPNETMKSILKHSKEPIDRIYKLSEYWDKYNRIFRIYSEKDTLYVFYNKPLQNYGTLDIWHKKDNSWILYKENIEDFIDHKNTKTARNSINYTSKYILFKENKVYTFDFGIPLSTKKINTLKEEEIDKFKEKYFIENDNVLLLDIFSFRF
ncbi:MAG: hypothetical protein SPL98_05190 [Bacteroidales bacterium]|nr:hypothetical protein [Bacteroidales bacterium]MDY6394290.1 hypothetical protein [Bacteroidales bacterium]MDY6403368.1 hypothetical protein [Bacteroidales bacterium]MDY6423968.1 hypothetical protein [Bacteroidales bacterium]